MAGPSVRDNVNLVNQLRLHARMAPPLLTFPQANVGFQVQTGREGAVTALGRSGVSNGGDEYPPNPFHVIFGFYLVLAGFG
jgi:hypothetical protein